MQYAVPVVAGMLYLFVCYNSWRVVAAVSNPHFLKRFVNFVSINTDQDTISVIALEFKFCYSKYIQRDYWITVKTVKNVSIC